MKKLREIRGTGIVEIAVAGLISAIVVGYVVLSFNQINSWVLGNQFRLMAVVELDRFASDLRSQARNRSENFQLTNNHLFPTASLCSDQLQIKQKTYDPAGTSSDITLIYQTICAPAVLSNDPATLTAVSEICPANTIPKVQVSKDGTIQKIYPTWGKTLGMSACFRQNGQSVQLRAIIALGKDLSRLDQSFTLSTTGRSGNVIFLPPQ